MKTRYPRAAALAVAKGLVACIEPFCERIAIAGSLRRERPEVGDVELLYVGKIVQRPDGLFDTRPVNLADEEINRLLAIGALAKRPNVNGHFAWGEKNKLGIHTASGIPVDLFSTTEKHWNVSLVIRTGPRDFNLRLIDSAAKRGLKLHAYGEAGFTDARTGEEVPVTSERHVFELAGVEWLEPRARFA